MARIEIVKPPAHGVATGNRHTAHQWARILEGLGHEVTIGDRESGFAGDLLIGLNAVKTREAIAGYRERRPDGKLVVCLSGTDIYQSANTDAEELLRASLVGADRLVVLQHEALQSIPAEFRKKARVIVQGVVRMFAEKRRPGRDRFVACVVGHLREVKDPLRAAAAARLLERGSDLEVRQAGAILEERYAELVKEEEASNPRYHWLGELGEVEARRLIADSDVMVISSRSEGGARVVGEAVAEGTPLLASCIEGTIGLLGEDYPGYFPVGDTGALAGLLARAESDAGFRGELERAIKRAAPQFNPEREVEAWDALLRELEISQSVAG